MKKVLSQSILLVLLCSPLWLFGQSYTSEKSTAFVNQDDLQPEVYQARRAALRERMEPLSVAVFAASDIKMRSNDVPYRYRQDSNFWYLTGYNHPGALVMLVSEPLDWKGVTVRDIFFLPRGRGMESEADKALSYPGFDLTLSAAQFQKVLAKALFGKTTLCYSPAGVKFMNDPVAEKRYMFDRDIKKALSEKYPDVKLKSLVKELADMRQVKSAEEIALLQKAIDMTCLAHIEAAKSIEPGMFEYQAQAVIEYVFTRFGSEYPAFSSIIGSGPNSLILHYDDNRRKMADGDVVVMDIGAEYHGYSADVTRTLPVNGTFSAPQRELYELVLKSQRECIAMMKPGVTVAEINKKAQDVIGEGLVALGILRDKAEVRRFLPHGVSHDIGLDTHDVGAQDALRPNQVITIEPGVYIAANSTGVPEKYWNIGIRIEDDVLITETGSKVLSGQAPRTVADLEKLMRKKGVGNQKVGE